MQEQAIAIAFLARGRMLLCGEAGFKDSSGKRSCGWNEKNSLSRKARQGHCRSPSFFFARYSVALCAFA